MYRYDEYKNMVEEYLINFLPNIDSKSETIKEAMIYSLQAGGKRLRPVMLLAGCQFIDEKVDLKEALPFAIALEYIHTYSLIHDDLPAMDDDDLRRGKPTNHKVFGEGMAVLAGDGLLNSAFEIMTKELIKDFDKETMLKRKIKAMNVIASSAGCQGMIAGQVADIESEGVKSTEEMLNYINANKTGALITASIKAGAYIAGGSEKEIRDLDKYSQYLGLAFQIRDDILDIEGDEKVMGKAKGSDEKLSKFTYPSVYGIEESKKKLKDITEKSISILEEYKDRGKFFVELSRKLESRNK